MGTVVRASLALVSPAAPTELLSLTGRKPAPPWARRFHVKPGRKLKLRPWERHLFLELHAAQPERRLWTNVIAECLYAVYHSKNLRLVQEELKWVLSEEAGSLSHFEDLAAILDIDAYSLRRDVAADVLAGRIRCKALRKMFVATTQPKRQLIDAR